MRTFTRAALVALVALVAHAAHALTPTIMSVSKYQRCFDTGVTEVECPASGNGTVIQVAFQFNSGTGDTFQFDSSQVNAQGAGFSSAPMDINIVISGVKYRWPLLDTGLNMPNKYSLFVQARPLAVPNTPPCRATGSAACCGQQENTAQGDYSRNGNEPKCSTYIDPLHASECDNGIAPLFWWGAGSNRITNDASNEDFVAGGVTGGTDFCRTAWCAECTAGNLKSCIGFPNRNSLPIGGPRGGNVVESMAWCNPVYRYMEVGKQQPDMIYTATVSVNNGATVESLVLSSLNAQTGEFITADQNRSANGLVHTAIVGVLSPSGFALPNGQGHILLEQEIECAPATPCPRLDGADFKVDAIRLVDEGLANARLAPGTPFSFDNGLPKRWAWVAEDQQSWEAGHTCNSYASRPEDMYEADITVDEVICCSKPGTCVPGFDSFTAPSRGGLSVFSMQDMLDEVESASLPGDRPNFYPPMLYDAQPTANLWIHRGALWGEGPVVPNFRIIMLLTVSGDFVQQVTNVAPGHLEGPPAGDACTAVLQGGGAAVLNVCNDGALPADFEVQSLGCTSTNYQVNPILRSVGTQAGLCTSTEFDLEVVGRENLETGNTCDFQLYDSRGTAQGGPFTVDCQEFVQDPSPPPPGAAPPTFGSCDFADISCLFKIPDFLNFAVPLIIGIAILCSCLFSTSLISSPIIAPSLLGVLGLTALTGGGGGGLMGQPINTLFGAPLRLPEDDGAPRRDVAPASHGRVGAPAGVRRRGQR